MVRSNALGQRGKLNSGRDIKVMLFHLQCIIVGVERIHQKQGNTASELGIECLRNKS